MMPRHEGGESEGFTIENSFDDANVVVEKLKLRGKRVRECSKRILEARREFLFLI